MHAECVFSGTRQKIEYGLLLRMAGLLGGIRPPLTRSVLKAFLGPTTFTTRPDVVAFVRDSVQRVDVRSGGWAVRSVVPSRPDQRALLSRVTTPVLVVAGVEDATFPLSETIAMAEARNELAFIATGIYGKPLLNQNGAPLRLVDGMAWP